MGLATLAVLVWFFGGPMAHPDDYLFLRGGDGIQGYFAPAYAALYDSPFTAHFSGVNYPTGEHMVYPNLQPLLAWVLGWLHLGRHTIGVMNGLALLTLWLTPVLLYPILRRARLPGWYAALTALLIGFMSPQVDRLGQHMSLSYACFLPLLWYLLLRFAEAPRRWRWLVAYAAASLVMGLLMTYFLATACFFGLGFGAALYWQKPATRSKLWRLAVAALLPLLAYRTWLALTDLVADRPPAPYGLLVYIARWHSILLPVVGPLREVWHRWLPFVELGTLEGWAYVGLATTGVLGATVWGLLRRGWRRPTGVARRQPRWQRLLLPARPLPDVLRTAFPVALALLVLALGFPFILPGGEWLADHAGPVRQFRALGRFGWLAYYVLTVYGAYFLYRLWRLRRRQLYARGTPLPEQLARAGGWFPALLLLWAVEAYINVSVKAESVNQGVGAHDVFDLATSPVRHLRKINHWTSDFQAILPMPYYHMGSDKINLRGSESAIYQANKAALLTGLPLLSAYVSRGSASQALEHAGLFASTLLDKPLLAKFPSDKPLLVLVTDPSNLSPAEQRVLSLSQPLVLDDPQGALYALPVAALRLNTCAREVARADSLWPTLLTRSDGLRTTTPHGVWLQAFADAPDQRHGRLGPGAFHDLTPANVFSFLYRGPVPAPADTGRYEAAVWISSRSGGFGDMQVKVFGHGQQLSHDVVDASLATEVDGEWVRVVVPFRVGPGADSLEVIYDAREAILDDLLIRPLRTDVYFYTGPRAHRQLVKNTYRLTP